MPVHANACALTSMCSPMRIHPCILQAIRDDLKITASRVSDEAISAFFRQCDTDRNECIELCELLRFVQKPHFQIASLHQ